MPTYRTYLQSDLHVFPLVLAAACEDDDRGVSHLTDEETEAESHDASCFTIRKAQSADMNPGLSSSKACDCSFFFKLFVMTLSVKSPQYGSNMFSNVSVLRFRFEC